jgi:glyoxylase-like metal-dependent hydrolase (beta-lactamase superfamily II)
MADPFALDAHAPGRPVGDGWFSVRALADGVIAITEALGEVHPRWGPTLVHAYLVLGTQRGILIDAGLGIGDLRGAVEALTPVPVDLVLTHYHYDHVAGAPVFERVAMAAADAVFVRDGVTAEMAAFAATIPGRCSIPTPSGFDWATWRMPAIRPGRFLADGDVLEVGARDLEVIATPGHSPGSLCFLLQPDGILFTGDTLFAGGMHADMQQSDVAAYRASVARLRALGEQVNALAPAHGPTPIRPALLGALDEALAARRAPATEPRPVGSRLEYDFGEFSVTVPTAVGLA